MRIQLHQSDLSSQEICWQSWIMTRGMAFDMWDVKESVAPGIKAITGTATHKAIERFYGDKMVGKELPPGEAKEIAEAAFREALDRGYYISEEDTPEEQDIIADGMTRAEKFTAMYIKSFGNIIVPEAVEQDFVIMLDESEFGFDLTGRIDLIDAMGILHDSKTSGATPPKHAARTYQSALYAEAFKLQYGKYPEHISYDYVYFPSAKSSEPKADQRMTEVDDLLINPFYARLKQFEAIRKACVSGALNPLYAAPPPDRIFSWKCTKKHCPLWNKCEFWSGRAK